MNVKLLDCTLRDGGYINDWSFEFSNIKMIVNKLTQAKIDIIECGFLEDFEEYNENKSLFNNIDQIKQFIPINKGSTEYVAMTRFRKLDINNLKPYDGMSIDGIRVTFHLEEMYEAMDFCNKIKEKGYKVFVQPVGTTSYTDEELLSLIKMVNELQPYSFYMVDTLGIMTKKDVHRLFYLIDHNLHQDITIGFHSHNNLQLSFSNAQELISLPTNRTIFIDSSVYGMGRGAGNLNTELIAENINLTLGEFYSISYILEIVDEYIMGIRKKFEWGYSVPYYLAAIHNCHPNYATFLSNKKTLQVSSIAKVLNMIPREQRELYDKNLVEQLYYDFQTVWIDDKKDQDKLRGIVNNKEVLILVPGKSIIECKESIQQYIRDTNPVIIAIQFTPEGVNPDLVFFSNKKRVDSFSIDESRNYELLFTSNIDQSEHKADYIVNYPDLLNNYGRVKDNSTLMLLKLLEQLDVRKVTFAGFDGFVEKTYQNYVSESMETFLDEEILKEMNEEITSFLKEYKNKVRIDSITPTIFFEDQLSSVIFK